MLTIQVFSGVDTQYAAKLAYDNKLYVEGWTLSSTLKMFQQTTSDHYKICLVYFYGKLVGISLYSGFVQLFVNSDYRGNGIGKALYNTMVDELNGLPFVFGEGIDGSTELFLTRASEDQDIANLPFDIRLEAFRDAGVRCYLGQDDDGIPYYRPFNPYIYSQPVTS